MKYVLGLTSFAAFCYGLIVLPELFFASVKSDATVFQQISARIAFGMSAMVFVASATGAVVISTLQRNNSIREKLVSEFQAKRPLPPPISANSTSVVEAAAAKLKQAGGLFGRSSSIE